MSDFTLTLAHMFGPAVQLLFFWGLVLLFGSAICAAAFWGERGLLRTKIRGVWLLPFPILLLGLLYGGLRVSGLLRFPWDGWALSGIWNHTHLNGGTAVLFLCGCLLVGTALARAGGRGAKEGGK